MENWRDLKPVVREPVVRDPQREQQLDDYWFGYIRETCAEPHPNDPENNHE